MNNVKDKFLSVGLICMNKLNNLKFLLYLINIFVLKLIFNLICEFLIVVVFYSYK